jgi:hypothetical protein
MEPERMFLLVEVTDLGYSVATQRVFETEDEAEEYVERNELFDTALVEFKRFL